MGEECHLFRNRLELDRGVSSKVQILPSATHSSARGVCKGIVSHECPSQDKGNQVPGQAVHGSKEGYQQAKGDLRSFEAQQVHPLRQVSHVDSSPSSYSTSSGCLYCNNRPYRRLLACTHSKKIYPLPWLPFWQPEVCLQGNAVWPQYCPQSFHQTSKQSCEEVTQPRGSSGGLSGRLDCLGLHSRGVQNNGKQSHPGSPVLGVPDKQQEVKASASAVISMAGPAVGIGVSHLGNPSFEEERDCQTGQVVYQETKGIEENAGKGPGIPVICFHYRPLPQSEAQVGQQCLVSQSTTFSSRQDFENPISVKVHADPLHNCGESFKVCPSMPPRTVCDAAHRRFSLRVGRPLAGGSGSRELVTYLSDVSHQRPRSDGCVSIIEEDQSKTRLPHSSSFGQQCSNMLYKSKGVPVRSSQSCNVCDLQASQKETLALVSLPPGGSQERCSRLPVKDKASGVRVEARREIVQVHSEQSAGATSRPVCNVPKHSAAPLCLTQHRSSGESRGRLVGGLESMGKGIPVSSSQPAMEGPQQTQDIQGDGSSCGSELASKQLVSTHSGTQTSENPPSGSSAKPSCPKEDCLRFLLDNEQPSFDDFMAFANAKAEGVEAANTRFLENRRDSSLRQYRSSWAKFHSYVREQEPAKIDVNFCISFFRALQASGLAPGTIQTIKSGLHDPLWLGFGIDTNGFHLSRVSKACAKLSPAEPPPTSLSWSLDKVLRYALQLDNLECSYRDILGKTLFLVAMASAARVSEIQALSRDDLHISFNSAGEALLRPNRAFLAKNEASDNRWKPWKIIPCLEEPDLCPVHALRDYLSRTKRWSSGYLFRREGGGKLTVEGIRHKILCFIKNADPGSWPEAHDVRKVASSLNYFESMSFEDLKQYTGWKSQKVFYRHYVKSIEQVSLPVVAAG